MNSKRLWLAALMVFGVGPRVASSQINVVGLKSERWQTRAATLREIMAHPETISNLSIQKELIDCLEKEDDVLSGKIIEQPSPFDDETYGDQYLSMLEDAVFSIAKKTDNQRAYDALIPSAYNPESEIGQALANRMTNLKALLILSSSSGPGQRVNAAAGISKLLLLSKQQSDMTISGDRYREGKNTLRKLITNEADAPVRDSAIRGLAELSDKEDIPLLQKVANEDAASYVGKDGLTHYPVREAAVSGLNRMAAKLSVSPH